MKKSKITTAIFSLSLALGVANATATYLEELINHNELVLVGSLKPSRDSHNYCYDPRKYDCDVVSIIKKDLPEGATFKNKFEITGKFPHGDPAPVLLRDTDSFKEIGLAIPKVSEDLKPGKYIIFLHLREYYIGEKKFSEILTALHNINENILPHSESLEKEIINITQDLRHGKSIEASQSADLPNKLKLTISILKIKTGGNYPEFKLEAGIKNITGKDVYFYFDGCEIDFWRISVNGGKYFSISGAIHNHPCSHKNLIKLKPNQSIKKELLWAAFPTQHTYAVYDGKVETIKIGYNFASAGEPIALESNILKIQ